MISDARKGYKEREFLMPVRGLTPEPKSQNSRKTHKGEEENTATGQRRFDPRVTRKKNQRDYNAEKHHDTDCKPKTFLTRFHKSLLFVEKASLI
ncbi:MAG: hypothetical protein ABR875_04065 [Minisyncoccia bacterium]|jgi:hypothetical protein